MTLCDTSKPPRAIGYARLALEMTQLEFAEECGCKLSTLRSREYGLRGVPGRVAEKLSRKYGFSKESLIANEIGPCLMFNEKHATVESVMEWKAFQIAPQVVESMAGRAGRLTKHLVDRAARSGNVEYRNILADLSSLILKYRERGDELPGWSDGFTCRWDEIRDNNPTIWTVIESSMRNKQLKRKFFDAAVVNIQYETTEPIEPLLYAGGGQFFGQVYSIFRYRVFIYSAGKLLEELKQTLLGMDEATVEVIMKKGRPNFSWLDQAPEKAPEEVSGSKRRKKGI